VEIRRFGIGHRRHEGPSGTRGVDGQSIHSDARGAVAELAFRPNAAMAPHSNPNLTYFVVIEGGGFVQVGAERARVAAGEAIVWPPNVVHSAWTEQTPMRALIVEFAVVGPDLLMIEGGAPELSVEPVEPVESVEPVEPVESSLVRPSADPRGAGSRDPDATEAGSSKAQRKPAGGGLVSETRGRPHDHESPEREPW
jgi:quercetin dioxygenase-like cupin family protein